MSPKQASSTGRHCTMTVRAILTIATRIRRTVALAGAALLIVGLSSAGLPPVWQLPSLALADPGGNGNGKGNGGSKGNGGNSGEHQDNGKRPDNGKGPGANSKSGGDDGQDGEDGEDGDVAAPQAKTAAETERDGRDYVPDELVVANLGEDARSDVGRLGFVVLDEQQLASLGLKITRLRVPHQLTAPTARTLLASRYPGILVDLNAVYRPQGQLSLPPPDYPAKLIGWGHAPEDCGQGLRIGLLDTAVDAESPGLRGRISSSACSCRRAPRSPAN
jgi:hypothetical protein